MLIRIEEAPAALARVQLSVLNEAVSDLIRAHRRGDHLVVIGRAAAQWLQETCDLSGADVAMLSRIAQEYTQTGDLFRKTNIFVEITSAANDDFVKRGSAIIVSFSTLISSRILERALLLTENSASDGAFYNFLIHSSRRMYRCGFICVELVHGGGEDIVSVFGQLIDQRRIVCAIVDADSDYPSAGPSIKLRKLGALQRDSAWPLCFVTSPPCREVENLVPLHLLLTLPSAKGNPSNQILFDIDAAEQSRGGSMAGRHYLFFDIKNGRNHMVLERASDEAQAWVRSKLCLASVDYNEFEIKGYGDHVIRQILERNETLAALAQTINDASWRNVFAHFVSGVVWIFLGTTPIRT